MIHGDKLLRNLFVSIWVLVLLHMFAQYHYLYWQFRWLDMPMHFFGGVWVGFAVLWLWHYSGLIDASKSSRGMTYSVALVGGVLFGVVWEVCDYLVWTVGAGVLPAQYYLDTVGDLLMDIIGVHVAYAFFTRWHKSCVGK
jgi:hypothetical protein